MFPNYKYKFKTLPFYSKKVSYYPKNVIKKEKIINNRVFLERFNNPSYLFIFSIAIIIFIFYFFFILKPSEELSSWEWTVDLKKFKNEINKNNDINKKRIKSLIIKGLSEHYFKNEKRKIVNPHPFNFTINPGYSVCRSHPTKPLYLIYIHSSPTNFKRRLLIRQTWGNQFNFKHVQIKTIFMCGQTNNSTIQDQLTFESNNYNDIIQENFQDSYKNLTYKAIMSLKWIHLYCMNARFIIKTDDDIFLNIFKVIPRIESISKLKTLSGHNLDRTFICNLWQRMQVSRDAKSKWFVSKKEMKDNYFLPYCSGSVYIFTPPLASLLYRSSYFVNFFWIDDYYITGMLTSFIKKISFETINEFYFLSTNQFYEKFNNPSSSLAIGQSHNANHFLNIWKSNFNLYLNKIYNSYNNSNNNNNINNNNSKNNNNNLIGNRVNYNSYIISNDIKNVTLLN